MYLSGVTRVTYLAERGPYSVSYGHSGYVFISVLRNPRITPYHTDRTEAIPAMSGGGGPERAYPTEQDVLKKSCPLQ
jgi:hypothetical protein